MLKLECAYLSARSEPDGPLRQLAPKVNALRALLWGAADGGGGSAVANRGLWPVRFPQGRAPGDPGTGAAFMASAGALDPRTALASRKIGAVPANGLLRLRTLATTSEVNRARVERDGVGVPFLCRHPGEGRGPDRIEAGDAS